MIKIRILKTEEGFKVYPPDNGKVFMVGKIPLHWLVYYLSVHRKYNQYLAIEYIKRNYDLDVSKIINSDDWDWDSTTNIYEEFTNLYPRNGFNTSDRQYFESQGRKYFLKFVDWCGYEKGKDDLIEVMNQSVVHHIFPLVYGGTNKLENLIKLSSFNHDLLHENPLEKIEKYCFQAVDYLWYLYMPWDFEKTKIFIEKYRIEDYEKTISKKFMSDLVIAGIKNEMNEFYEYIKTNLERKNKYG